MSLSESELPTRLELDEALESEIFDYRFYRNCEPTMLTVAYNYHRKVFNGFYHEGLKCYCNFCNFFDVLRTVRSRFWKV